MPADIGVVVVVVASIAGFTAGFIWGALYALNQVRKAIANVRK